MNYIITNNREFFDKIGDYNFCNLEDMKLGNTIAVDTETTGLNPREGRMFAIQIGTGKDNYLVDMQDHNNGLQFSQVVPFIKGKTMVLHNATFDLTFMFSEGFYPKKIMDTFLCSKLLYNGYPPSYRHGFGYVMERELGVVYDKTEQKNIHNTQLRTHKTIQYSFNDVDRLLELMAVLWKKTKAEGMEVTNRLHFSFARTLAYMENSGMPFNRELWLKKMEVDEKEAVKASNKVIHYIYENLPKFRDNQIDLFSSEIKILPELSSVKQMIPVFEELGINIITDKGKKSIKEDVIKGSNHEFVELWLNYKHSQHAVNNFGQSILDKEQNGRIYTSFNPILDTARISTRSGGINFLNFPAKETTRSAIRCKDGNKIIVSDYSGQENFVGADLHQDPMLMKSIHEGLDLHCAFSRLIFPELKDLSDEEIIKNHSKKRKYSKAPRFLKSYGGAAYTMSKNLNIDMKEAQRLSDLFDELHAGIYAWGDEVYAESIKKGYIESAGGFRLHLPYFKQFKENQAKIEDLTRSFWQDYKIGKNQNKNRLKEDYNGPEKMSTEEELYLAWKNIISKSAKDRSSYMRLCLNNPIQSTSAHQTKLANILLFKHIEKNNHYGRVLICNAVHDEIVIEVEEVLADEYKTVLEQSMREGGDYFLTSGKLKMEADANIGMDWEEAK